MAHRRNGSFIKTASRFGAVMAIALGLLQLALGSVSDALVGASCAIVCAVAALNHERAERGVGLHVVIGALTATFAASIFLVSIAYISWLGTVSVIAIMLLGRRAGLAWTVVISLVLVAAVWLLPDAPTTMSPGTPLVRLVRIVSCVPTMAAIALLFEAQRSDDVAALEHAMHARSRLLANVSHEMRTPLNGIIGMIEALRSEQLPPPVRERIDVIHFSGETLLALINELLDVTRAEAAGEVVRTPTDVTALVSRTVELHRARAEAAGKRVSLHTPAGAVPVLSDPVRIQQVVGNLVANAVKHGGSQVDVTFTATTTNSQTALRIEVADDGEGISPQQEAHLFQPFAQLNPLTAMGGSGLGLFISRGVARLLGGELSLVRGEGCRFVFTLTAAATGVPGEVTSTRAAPLSAARVMVVDDNVINRKVASALLQKYGLTVLTAEAGEPAIDALLTQPVDVVFMDLQMPGIDGLEATRRLRKGGYGAPIVALTASAEPEIASQCEAAGMNGLLLKPLQLRALEPMLARLLPSSASV